MDLVRREAGAAPLAKALDAMAAEDYGTAQMAGTEMVWDHTYRIARRPLLGAHDTGAGTRRQVERFVIDPNVIKLLPTGEAVLITKLPRAQARTVRVLPPPAHGAIARPVPGRQTERPPPAHGAIERE